MPNFDFVSGNDFRMSLEADYAELQASIKVQAWKAAHVLAGSIVEAILIDYLVAIKYSGKSEDAVMTMSLEGAIAACKQEKYLSSRAADLSAVVRGYRNLIHPGRVVRLGETVDEQGAKVAQALVEMIISEVTSRKRETFGYTAEQILTKLQQDTTVRPVLALLLRETQPRELERLLIGLLPQRYYELSSRPLETDWRILDNMRVGFAEGFAQADDALKRRIAKQFVKIVKESTGDFVREYEGAFFSGFHLQYLVPEDQQIAKQHVLSQLQEDETLPLKTFCRMIQGIGPFLRSSDCAILVISIIRELASQVVGSETYSFHAAIKAEYQAMDVSSQKAMMRYLEPTYRPHQQYTSRDSQEKAAKINELKAYLDDDLPF